MFFTSGAFGQNHHELYIKVESDPAIQFRSKVNAVPHYTDCNDYQERNFASSAEFLQTGPEHSKSCVKEWHGHGPSLVSSSSDRHQNASWKAGNKIVTRSPSSSSPSRSRAKEQKRDRANEQERRRMKQINDALDDLRLVLRDKPIPVLPMSVQKHRESKIKTLTAAIAYIKFLQQQLNHAK
jgi:hypothetical protein